MKWVKIERKIKNEGEMLRWVGGTSRWQGVRGGEREREKVRERNGGIGGDDSRRREE